MTPGTEEADAKSSQGEKEQPTKEQQMDRSPKAEPKLASAPVSQEVDAKTVETTKTSIEETYGEMIRNMNQAYCSVNDELTTFEQARIVWSRQAAFWTFFINAAFLIGGALFFASQTDWSAIDVALFTVYTVTSAGYGHVEIPDTPLFQIWDTFYILAGLSLMAIMMAQIYQFLELEAKRMQSASSIAEVVQQGLEQLRLEPPSAKRDEALQKLEQHKKQALGLWERCICFLTRIIASSVDNPWGDFLHRIGSLASLALLGAIVVGNIEGWTWYTSFYWSVVSLTTVGYGDVVPQTVAGKAFTTAWLPLNLFFLSILFCSVGHYYLRFSDQQIARIQRGMQEKRAFQLQKAITAREASSMGSSEDLEAGNQDVEADQDAQEATVPARTRRDRTRQDSTGSTRSIDLPRNRRFFGAHLNTMKDVLCIINETDFEHLDDGQIGELDDPSAVLLGRDAPNFYLRVKAKERVAFIVAEEIAGSPSSLTTADKAGVLSVYLEGTVSAAEKWMIPRRARRAFRAVAFEALLFVGESTLLKEGDAALHRLSPMEFHRIFSPLLVAMHGMLESWLVSTELLWEKESNERGKRIMSKGSLHFGHKNFATSGEKIEFFTNHAEGFHLFQDT